MHTFSKKKKKNIIILWQSSFEEIIEEIMDKFFSKVIVCLFVCLFVVLHPKSTAMVIAGRSVHQITLFPGQA